MAIRATCGVMSARTPIMRCEIGSIVRNVSFAIAVPALSSHVRPALVLAERESRALQETTRNQDVTRGGRFSASPACIQVWDGPWAHDDDPGDAVHLGSVDWSNDTPVRHYVTIYRAMVTAGGVCTDCGRTVPVGDLVVAPGPGLAARPAAGDPVSRALAVPHRLLEPLRAG